MSPTGSTPLPAAVDPALLDGVPAFERLVAEHTTAPVFSAGNLWGSSQAMVVAGLQRRAQGPWLVIVSNEVEAEAFADDLAAFGVDGVVLPARERAGRHGGPSRTGDDASHADPDSVRRRMQVARAIAGPREARPRLLVASLLSVLQPVPSPEDLERDVVNVRTGRRLDTEELLERLVRSGYARQPLAERPGEASVRGDIVDVYPFAANLPVRIELFDEEIESIRVFDPETQRSVETLESVALCIAADAGGIEDGHGRDVVSLLSPATVFVEIEPLRIEDQAEGMRIRSTAHKRALQELAQAAASRSVIRLQSLPGETVGFDTRSAQAFSVGLKEAPRLLLEAAGGGSRVVVLCRTETEERRFREHVDEEAARNGAGDGRDGAVGTALGSVARGFRLPAANLVVVNHRELAGVLGARGAGPRAKAGQAAHAAGKVRALQSFFELKVGDLVVHAVHGVARYAGLTRLERAGGEEEHLHLIFEDDVALFVPSGRIDLVQRYVGGGGGAPQVDKIGGAAFRRRKEKVERALVDLAAELLEVQARRELQRRPPWEPDAALVRDLHDSFPYTDTLDQAAADAEIAADLTGEKPMDRLLCGDVGFGKTEIAVRAAFRVVTCGAQVAVLVPTTVLAQQHYETFRERLSEFPVEVAVLSRYVSGEKERDTVARVARGQVDVLIGTHRILSKDLSFPRLGLVIVDEEQRFGVKHKEHFKGLRASVDMLTLSATPIPRTLHMSLAGLRDISALSEPPEGRQEIETLLTWNDERSAIREALLREKNRGGQVFFLHNRVQSIQGRARELQELVPECSYAVGHGQMAGGVLKRVMDTFDRGDVDVLVATTIIENGIDIPTAGTIVVDDADRFGLAELHQLRGRVGRGRNKSYCYLLVDRSKPLKDEARRRLAALQELTQLGAGFQISMKDLELRGAGNILGPEQSGHIAAVGYDMYCRLLKQTVDRMGQGVRDAGELLSMIPGEVEAHIEAEAVEMELGISAFLPKEWIPSADTRIEILRRLAALEDEAQADEARAALRDRYGRVPEEAEALLRQFRLRPRLAHLGIRRILWREETYFVEYADRVALEQALAGRDDVELRPLRAGQAHLVVPRASRASAAEALTWFESLLPPLPSAPSETRMAAAPS